MFEVAKLMVLVIMVWCEDVNPKKDGMDNVSIFSTLNLR